MEEGRREVEERKKEREAIRKDGKTKEDENMGERN